MATRFSGNIPENVIEEIITKNDIVSVVGEYVKFTKTSGSNLFGLCPFHSEDTPSFSVSKTKQICHCFGCHKGGNVIHFIMEIEKCRFPEALQILADKAGIKIPEPEDRNYKEKTQIRDQVRQALLETARYYYRHFHSPSGKAARDYLLKRDISPATAKAFGLGYAPEDWAGLYRYLKEKKFSDEVLAQSGLFTRKSQGEFRDLFRGRLMFPIFDTMGKIIAFGGRILKDGEPKYINSPESVVYSKQRTLYALNFAKNTREKKIIVAEGYMDVISMHQAGFTNAVAPLGTALTDLQMNLAARYTEEVIFFFDSDRAGQQAALRSLQMIMQKNSRKTNGALKISVARVPDGKDPDDYIRMNGAGEFKKLIDDAYSASGYLLYSAKEQATTEGKLDLRTYKAKVCEYLSWEADAVLRERAAREAAQFMGVSAESVLEEVGKTKIEAVGQIRKEEKRELERQEQKRLSHQDNAANIASEEEIQVLCYLSLLGGEEYKSISKKDIPYSAEFTAGIMQEIAKESLASLEDGFFDAGMLLEICRDKVVNQRAAKELFSEVLMTIHPAAGKEISKAEILLRIFRLKRDVYKEQKNRYYQMSVQTSDESEKKRYEAKMKKFDEYYSYVMEQLNGILHG